MAHAAPARLLEEALAVVGDERHHRVVCDTGGLEDPGEAPEGRVEVRERCVVEVHQVASGGGPGLLAGTPRSVQLLPERPRVLGEALRLDAGVHAVEAFEGLEPRVVGGVDIGRHQEEEEGLAPFTGTRGGACAQPLLQRIEHRVRRLISGRVVIHEAAIEPIEGTGVHVAHPSDRPVAALLQAFGERPDAGREDALRRHAPAHVGCAVVVGQPVHVRREPGQDARDRRLGPRGGGDRVLEDDALVGQEVQVGRRRPRVAGAAHVRIAKRADRDEDDVRSRGCGLPIARARARARDERSADPCRGGLREW